MSSLLSNYHPSDARYSNMEYRQCGTSGLKLPILSLGLWQNFGDVDNYENARQIIFDAFDLGVTCFDLASNYGNPRGSSEKTFGRILKEDLHSYRDEIIVSTKAGYRKWPGPYGECNSKKHMVASLNQSLKSLNLEYVDIFYSHKIDFETAFEETIEAMVQLVKQGKVLYLGISSYGPKETIAAKEISSQLGTSALISNQCSYSMLNRWIEPNLLDTLNEVNVGCVAFTALEQGLLTEKYITDIPKNSRASNEVTLFSKESLKDKNVIIALKNLNNLAHQRQQTLAQMSLSWVLKNKNISSVVVGARNSEQIKENIMGLNTNFSTEELNLIDEYVKDIDFSNPWLENASL